MDLCHVMPVRFSHKRFNLKEFFFCNETNIQKFSFVDMLHYLKNFEPDKIMNKI